MLESEIHSWTFEIGASGGFYIMPSCKVAIKHKEQLFKILGSRDKT